ncbi:MAG TPA: hypothetical protein VMM77_11780 [Gemmatimonadaceae bacterium]|nr:hypothetical protein [Gemmatimonadaceae bacterium]
MDPDGRMVVTIVAISSSVAIMGTIAWAYIERLKLRPGATSKQLGSIDERLARMENAIDAMSLEVERISEGQRFTARLLADNSTETERTPTLERGT